MRACAAAVMVEQTYCCCNCCEAIHIGELGDDVIPLPEDEEDDAAHQLDAECVDHKTEKTDHVHLTVSSRERGGWEERGETESEMLLFFRQVQDQGKS